jgi:hypothetical protein
VYLGKGQAWYYREARICVLWELLTHRGPYGRQPEEARRDELLRRVWEAFERYLAETFPAAGRIYTGGSDPAYADWPDFLIDRGWRPDPEGREDAPDRWTRPWPPTPAAAATDGRS